MRSNKLGGIHFSPAGDALAIILVAAGLSGCTGPRLVPVSPSEGAAATVQSAGISVQIAADAGELPVYLPADVEPVRISIHNGSDHGIHVPLDGIELEHGSRVFATLVPSAIEPRPYVTGTGLDPASPFALPGPVGVDLRLATQYPAMYRQLAFGDAGEDARRADIIRKAFAGGFIDRGETVEGLVYFAEPPANVHELNLVIPMNTGEGSGAFTEVTVPLVLKG